MMRRLSGNFYKTWFLLGILGFSLLAGSCQKYTDEPGKSDPRLSRKYCNDPEAVNFNRDFPGTADNSVCYYPSDVFAGNYSFVDSIYDGGNALLQQVSFSLSVSKISKVQFALSGFCAGGGSPTFTSSRSLRATADTTIVGRGQIFCRNTDTLSGTITQSLSDSTRLKFSLTVVADTGTTYHKGTAYRQ